MIMQYQRFIRYKNGYIKVISTLSGVVILAVKENKIVEVLVNNIDLYNDDIINTMIESYKIKYKLQFKQSDTTYIQLRHYNFIVSGNEKLIDIAASYNGSNVIRDLCFYGNYFCLNNIISLTALFLPK